MRKIVLLLALSASSALAADPASVPYPQGYREFPIPRDTGTGRT